MGLSKGTLGLKFMNRQAPVAASTPPPPPSAPAAAAASTTTPATSKPANPTASAATATATRKTDGRTTNRNEWDASSTGSRTSVVHETSLLSFPLLSTLNKNQAASSSSMTATYSSMPLTSAMVSGRRSFGGANVEIEKLNDPSSHQAAPEGTADSSSSKKSTKTSKRPKKADRDATLVESVRGGGKNKSGSVSSSKVGKRTADLERRSAAGAGLEEEEDGANKKKRRKTDELNGVTARWELDDDGERSIAGAAAAAAAAAKSTTKKVATEFARPAGFDGVKKKQAKPAATDSRGQSKGKGRMMDDEQYQWAKQGETREWDAGKSSEEEEEETDSEPGSDDDGEEERMVSSSSDEEESSEEDEAVLADEQRFSEAADRAAAGGGGTGGGGGRQSRGNRGGRAGSQSKSQRGQGRR